MTLRYWHVDAFARRPFAGNPAAVVLLDDLSDAARLQALAEEIGLPATAFVTPDRTIRWFSPGAEIALCGHGALAAGHVVLAREGGEAVAFRSVSGSVVEVRREGAGHALALPAVPTRPAARSDVGALLGADPQEVRASASRHVICLFDDEAQVRALAPDLAALAAGRDDQFICTARGWETDVVSRVFVGGPGAREDAVTGSAHAALAPFWAARLGRDRLTAHQASARGGDLACRLDGDRVWLAGGCVTVAEGVLYLPG
ncbi:PhzF family phenazine biosynthesis protein [Tsuneonella sp. YG55]|uniref:PhzF family phenazine biosynthesis protein n=1 Tax=Tsuneonella litorea TaxID=2976475 RepID=A0A9X2VYP9_9SPHN|nr:PhzF family phenazine biosynthesis protein [Tsuneonella litorea]MCT2557772.1 PhzF family phenazine biosynthesis protein [Tsuneonella litorea]